MPGRAQVWVGEVPLPVVPSPNSQRSVVPGWLLTVVSEVKLTDWPAVGLVGENVKPGVVPLAPVVTIPPAPVDVPSVANTVSPTEYAPAAGKVWLTCGPVRMTVEAPKESLNCHTYLATPGAVDPVASKFNLRPVPAATANGAVGAAVVGVNRCRQLCVLLLHSSWYQ